MVSGCPAWLETAVFYEIYPQSFYDSNNDGIGDLCGIIEKLDYVKYMGFNAIWINPCFVSPFQDAGYDVADYCKIDPRYGTNDDMRRLFDEARKRGIRVCLDLVAGHTSVEHPWFQKSCMADANPYTNRYIWTDNVWHGSDGKFDLVRGFAQRSGNYVTNFFHFQPALNYGFAEPDPAFPWQLPTDHPDVLATREDMKNVMRFWLDMGASGFRVDMAPSLVKNDPQWKATGEFWRDVRNMFNAEYPDAALISEWSSPEHSIGAGFHIDFLLHCFSDAYNSLFRYESELFGTCPDPGKRSFFSKDGMGDITEFTGYYLDQLKKTREHGYISLISGNHDQPRIARGRDMDELAVAFAFILTMPGVPFVYYGDEIGMRYIENLPSKEGGYERTGSRTPMQWNSGKNAGFSECDESDLYLPVDPDKNAPNVELQMGVDGSLLETIRNLIFLRMSEPALRADTDFIPVLAHGKEYPFIYLRSGNESSIIVAVNPGSRSVSVNTGIARNYNVLASKGVHASLDNNSICLQMDGVSYCILKLDS